MISLEDIDALEALDAKLRAILPEQYQDSYGDVLPVSMSSAGLRYDVDGRVAWDQIWGSFCDLALAGGPPHRGTLLVPTPTEVARPYMEKYYAAAAEICRGISMVTGLPAEPAPSLGWVRVRCKDVGMAAWLVRAIVAENILARHEAEHLYLPAGAEFRLDKEIKNVITAIAKTCHYWTKHIPAEQQRALEELFANPSADSVLLEPAQAAECRGDDGTFTAHAERIARGIYELTGLKGMEHAKWMGIEFSSVRDAIWMMRALIVENIVTRRERTLLLLPLNHLKEGHEERIVRTFSLLYRLGKSARIL